MNAIYKIGQMPFILLALSIFCNSALATQITFTATNFENQFGLATAPQQTVAAKFDYSDNSGVLTLNYFNMTIMSKTYSLADITYSQFGQGLLFGGPLNGLHGLQWGTDDFYMTFNPIILSNGFLMYTTVGSPNDVWSTGDAEAKIGWASVSEPESLVLFGLGLFSLGIMRRNRHLS